TRAAPLQSGATEQATATAYLELILRCVSERGLLRAVLHFLFVYEYDGIKLSMVTLSLMETLTALNSEDVMVELVFKKVLDYRTQDERRVNGVHDIALSPLVHDLKFYYGNPNESLIGNYHAYLCDARFEIVSRTMAVSNWTSKYDHITLKRETNNNKETRDTAENTKEQDSLISVCTSEYDTLKTSDTSEKEQHSLTSLTDVVETDVKVEVNGNHDSLISIGDSSDYESFKNYDDVFAEDMFRKRIERVEETREYEEMAVRSWRILSKLKDEVDELTAQIDNSDELVDKARVFLMQRELTLLNARAPANDDSKSPSYIDNSDELVDMARVFLMQRELTLLNARAPANDDSKSPSYIDNSDELVDKARVFLMQRELTLLNARAPANDDSKSPSYIVTDRQLGRASGQGSRVPNHSPTPQKRAVFTQDSYWSQSITIRTILNAVLLDEWLKELAALCEEHALRLSADSHEDDSYIRTVAL
ncbi:Uncharacterized protein OBRU01_02111, partial [Operophtera brumata]